MLPDPTSRRTGLETLLDQVKEVAPRRASSERLETELHSSSVVRADGPEVRLGSRVLLQQEGKVAKWVRLLLPDDVEGRGDVSVMSTLGCSLLGARAGAVFSCRHAGKKRRFAVLTVEQP